MKLKGDETDRHRRGKYRTAAVRLGSGGVGDLGGQEPSKPSTPKRILTRFPPDMCEL